MILLSSPSTDKRILRLQIILINNSGSSTSKKSISSCIAPSSIIFLREDSEEEIREAVYSRFGKFERLSLLHKIEDMTHVFNGSVIVVFESIAQADEAEKGMEFNGRQITTERMEIMLQRMATNKKLRKNKNP